MDRAWDPAGSWRHQGPGADLAFSYGRDRPDFRPSRAWERSRIGPAAFVRLGLWSSILSSEMGWTLLLHGEAWWTLATRLGRWTAWLEGDMAQGRQSVMQPAPVSLGGVRLGRGLPPRFLVGGSLVHGSVEFRRLLLGGIEGMLFVDWDCLGGFGFRDWSLDGGIWSAGGRVDLSGLGDFSSYLQVGFAEQSFVLFAGVGRRL